jgi:putative 4-mercaptohistidine N1-methyltranferase
MNPYETDRLLGEYLLFHYGSAAEISPPAGAESALFYPVRCVDSFERVAIPDTARALDAGCAVGRSTFELTRFCSEVIGIDLSQRFIAAASHLRDHGMLEYHRADEGALTTPLEARVDPAIPRYRARFAAADACALPDGLGQFDIVLAANLIDRLPQPSRFLAQLPALLKPGGQLLVTSPYTWMGEFTPREHWLGGFVRGGERVATLEGLRASLDPAFTLASVKDLPFLIREHARKFQWSVAQASLWIRRH